MTDWWMFIFYVAFVIALYPAAVLMEKFENWVVDRKVAEEDE